MSALGSTSEQGSLDKPLSKDSRTFSQEGGLARGGGRPLCLSAYGGPPGLQSQGDSKAFPSSLKNSSLTPSLPQFLLYPTGSSQRATRTSDVGRQIQLRAAALGKLWVASRDAQWCVRVGLQDVKGPPRLPSPRPSAAGACGPVVCTWQSWS